MQLILLLVLERPRAHVTLEGILINVSLYVSLQVVRLCELLLTDLEHQQLATSNRVDLCQLTSHL